MKSKSLVIILVLILIGVIGFCIYKSTTKAPINFSNSQPVIIIDNKNGGLINANDPNTWIEFKYEVYSNRGVKLYQEYGGNNITNKEYKISEQNYNQLLELLKDRDKNIEGGFAMDYMPPTLTTYKEDGSEETYRINSKYYESFIKLLEEN